MPQDKDEDVQLNLAEALLRGEKTDTAFPPSEDSAVNASK